MKPYDAMVPVAAGPSTARSAAVAWAGLTRALGRYGVPALLLAMRLALAGTFFASGVIKLVNWDAAVLLAASEYPLAGVDPVTWAAIGVAVEVLGALALAAGLGTRFAAAALLALTLFLQLSYRELDVHLMWAALLATLMVFGAGPVSLDRPLSRGLAASAVPLAGRTVHAFAALTVRGGPVFLTALRVWVAAAFNVGVGAAPWLPQFANMEARELAVIALTVMLAAGLGTRLAALTLAAGAVAGFWMAPAPQDALLWHLLLLLLAAGGGALSVDAPIRAAAARAFPQMDGRFPLPIERLPRVVIVGAGFAGIACAARLAREPVQVTLVDRNNYHLFQPLLYQVATAALSPGDIATPIRGLFRDRPNVRVLLGEVTGVDAARRAVLLGGQGLAYDYLVLATGAAHSYFGKDQWASHAPGLKRVEDALAMRRRLLTAFEQAEATDDPRERERLLTFLIVGGGPTGVKLAGAIAELARFGMDQEFRRFDPAQARVVLVQAAPRLLPGGFPEAMGQQAKRSLERLGVSVRLSSRVEAIDADGVTVSGERIDARTVLWAAGVQASPAARWLGAAADAAGRVAVGPDLSVPGHDGVFVVGDTAACNAWGGNPVPGLAPAAKQQGRYAARVIAARVAHRAPPAPFAYRHMGSLATIGRKSAVVDFGFLRLSGAPAWWLWGLVHVGFLVGVRNRVSVMLDWLWSYLTFRGGTPLITGGPAPGGE
ncbi:MAG: NAD(P)/FAD-dependent oxidoreductase [Pseudomonadota bacterium]